MEIFVKFLQKESTKRVLILLFIGLGLYFMRGMMNLILLTFMFTYLIHSLQEFILRGVNKLFPVKRIFVTLILYAALLTTLVLVLYRYIPMIAHELQSIFEQIKSINLNVPSNNPAEQVMLDLLKQVDYKKLIGPDSDFMKSSFGYATETAIIIGEWGFNLAIALLMSLFFNLDTDRLKHFADKFKDSAIAGLYAELVYFCNKFLNSFGKVMQAQILIAITNSVLSVIALYFLHFPQLLGIGCMIFILSLIPVAGVVISFVPLSLIAYSIGGFQHVIYVIIMILALHAIEAYILNPKFMSDKTELPVFLVFAILLVSEHFLGVWGLIIGIPIFIFILDLLNVDVSDLSLKAHLPKKTVKKNDSGSKT